MRGDRRRLLAASGTLGDAFIKRFAESGRRPVVMVNRRVRGAYPSVTVDDAAGVALAVRHLAALGHTTIAGIFGTSPVETIRRRRSSFIATGARESVRTIEIDSAGLDLASGRAAAFELFDRHAEVTAVFASTFAIGVGTLRAARERGIGIPDEVSLIAFHYSELADYLNPPLSTVRLPVEEMAQRAVDLLIEVIDGGESRSLVVKTAPVLNARESIAPPRKLKRPARAAGIM